MTDVVNKSKYASKMEHPVTAHVEVEPPATASFVPINFPIKNYLLNRQYVSQLSVLKLEFIIGGPWQSHPLRL